MSRITRFTFVASIAALSGSVALYACSSDPETTPGVVGGNTQPGVDGSDPPDGGGTDSPANVDSGPKTCAFIADGGARVPEMNPQVCKDCIIANCCAQVTKCYGGQPADAGVDGSDGVKSACKLFGECETDCGAAHAAGSAELALCEFKCGQAYGQNAAADYAAAEGCRYGAPPAGCANACP